MSQRRTSHAGQAGLPGLSTINDLVSTSFSIWKRHVQVLNEVVTDCTRAEATTSDWPKAWSKLLQTWTDDAQDICGVFTPSAGTCRDGGSPFVTFVIDRSAETDARPQIVPVPAGVDVTKLVATPLVSLTEDGHPSFGGGVILLLPVDGCVEIRVAVPTDPPRPGHYLSVVCEPKAGAPTGGSLTNSPDPPVRTVAATVLVVFI